MDEKPISVTTAARKFADCINLVRYQGASFLLEKNGVPVARIVPVLPSLDSEAEQFADTASRAGLKAPESGKPEHNLTGSLDATAEAGQYRLREKRRPFLNW
jgi:antitoxin (DNA-binding transcriptional repressor) of toxin-antitoxin stability system